MIFNFIRDFPEKKNVHVIAWIFFFFLPVIYFSCSGVSLSQRIIINKNDWLMCGGNASQQNVSQTVLNPPFTLLWSYDCDAGIGNSAVVASDAVVFVNDLNGELQLIDISSGSKIGLLNFLGGDANTSPLLIDDRVVVAYSGDNNYSLAEYNFLTRDFDWRIDLGYLQTSPVLYDTNIYVGSLNGKEYKIGLKKGKILWSFDTKSQIHSTCAVDNGKVVFGADNGYIYCLNSLNGAELWKYKTGASVVSAPLIYNNTVFTGSYDSSYYALSLDSGQVKWKTNMSTKIYSGSALYRNNLLFGGIDGNLYSLSADNGEKSWVFQTNGVVNCTPLVAGNNVYFTSFDWFAYCLDASNGKMLWNSQLEGKGRTTPVIWKDFLLIPNDKYIYCFKEDHESSTTNGNK